MVGNRLSGINRMVMDAQYFGKLEKEAKYQWEQVSDIWTECCSQRFDAYGYRVEGFKLDMGTIRDSLLRESTQR